MNYFRADLHCHSTFSDGTCTPLELITLAKEIGLQGLSITDHDTLGAYPEAISLAEDEQIQMIPGVEFSTEFQGVSIHVLAYAFQYNHPVLLDFCKEHERRREARLGLILKKLAEHNMPLTKEEVLVHASSQVGRPHIAKAMELKGYVPSIEKAFKYLGEGKPCYATTQSISTERTLDLIHKAGGLAILAHPHLIKETQLIPGLLSLDFDGIEGHYGTFSAEEDNKWIALGEKKGLIVTGGSDFHGTVKPRIALGVSWVPAPVFDRLLEHSKKNNPT